MDRAESERIWARIASRVARVQGDLVMAFLDGALTVAAIVAMLLLRFEGSVPEASWTQLEIFLPIAVAVTIVSNWAWGLYGQLWRHASMYEARRLVMSGVTVTAILTGTRTRSLATCRSRSPSWARSSPPS